MLIWNPVNGEDERFFACIALHARLKERLPSFPKLDRKKVETFFFSKKNTCKNCSLSLFPFLQALLARRGRAAATPAGAEAAAAVPFPAAPIFPRPQPQTSDRHPRSSSVTKKTSAADATCFSVLPCGKASILGLASAMPETATRAKPAVDKSLEERGVGAELPVFFESFFLKAEEVREERRGNYDGDDG